ncbi:hypothetical protein K438DRAFT_1798120 [Mycena galopus ATCC 62051]|nr:hypothetical protein K438DRAFT_1798120 [Mycena galopus ATCC 62051]
MIILPDEFSKPLALEQIPHIEVRIQRCSHHCTQCEDSESDSEESYSEKSTLSQPPLLEYGMSWGRKLAYCATCISSCIFALSLAEFFAAGHYNRFTGICQIFVAIYSVLTSLTMMILLLLGRTRGSRHTLARAVSQIYVLCGMGLTWIGVECTLVAINDKVYGRTSAWIYFVFVIENILCWSLFITMFGTAYATYRRAVTVHGDKLVTVVEPVAAWTLSHISDSSLNMKQAYSDQVE